MFLPTPPTPNLYTIAIENNVFFLILYKEKNEKNNLVLNYFHFQKIISGMNIFSIIKMKNKLRTKSQQFKEIISHLSHMRGSK